MSAPTKQQLEAIAARGNALVSAGAGTGKTSVVVERCLRLVLDEFRSLENILMVTFTEAAAAEMRERIRETLRQHADRAPAGSRKAGRLAEELALLDAAPVSTLHGFCLELVRQNFQVVGIDPQFTVLDEQQTGPLIREVLDGLLRQHYADRGPGSEAVRALVRTYGRGNDESVRRLIVKLHRHTQALAGPARWFDDQIAAFSDPSPSTWRQALADGVREWAGLWRGAIESFAPGSVNVRLCAEALAGLPLNPTFEQAADVVARIVEADGMKWHGLKKHFRDPLKAFFTDAAFLNELAGNHGEALAQDWSWAREHMLTLLGLARQFTRDFTEAKRALAGVDFADLEQLALRLLYDDGDELTPIALACRKRFAFVFVDECQDINGAQDAILRALSREGAEANRFLVGDAKQSIYRFRLADPRIFQNYEERWGRVGADGRFLRLTENFRSREALLRFINSVFGALMRPAVGGNPGADAELEFGDRANRIALSLDAKTTEATRRADDRTDPGEVAPCVELHLIARDASTDAGNESESDEVVSDDLPDLPATELEARLIALRLRQLKESGHRIWNLDRHCFEPVEYRDMVVLMRSTAGRAEAFAKMFHQAGVPLEAERAGFFDALEVTDLLNLLRLLDNPWQDVPLLAVLRSPLVGLSPDELVRVRLSERREPFWFALQRFLRAGRPAEPGIAATWQKTDWFVQRLAAWRELLRHSSLSDCLENALTETHYEVLLAGERGPARVANVRRLVDLARRFDPYQRQGLFRFLRFVAQQEDAEVRHEPMPLAVGNAVRLITIHRSKGLEFPVVVVAGLGSPFNFRELSEDILLQEDLGLCPKVLPPGGRRRYPSVAHWLAGQRERRARLGEEMRLLYVALTRAKDTIILVGAASKKGAAEPWREPVPVTDLALVRAGCYLDWMRLWLSQATRPVDWLNDREGANGLLRWKIHDAAIPALALPEAEAGRETDDAIVLPFESDRIAITERLSWRYPFEPATKEPGKTSASALRRRLRDETDEEAGILFPQSGARTGSRFRATSGKLSAADIGTANHVFLQMVTLERTGSRNELEGEAERLRRAGVLTDDEVGALNFGGLLAFWQSELGRRIRAQSAQNVHRELPFTARMSPADFVALKLPVNGGLADEEFVVVQGVIDLAVIRPEEIWLVEFKTDDASHRELPEKVKLYESQVKLYALALTRIYRRRIAESWLHFLSLDDTVRI